MACGQTAGVIHPPYNRHILPGRWSGLLETVAAPPWRPLSCARVTALPSGEARWNCAVYPTASGFRKPAGKFAAESRNCHLYCEVVICTVKLSSVL